MNYLPDMIEDVLIAKSSMDKCSSAPSTSLLSTSEKTMTILFFWTSGIDSSVKRELYSCKIVSEAHVNIQL